MIRPRQLIIKFLLAAFLLCAAALLLTPLDGARAQANETARSEERPNVVLINVGDLGYGDVGAYGATKVKTPNMERLAQEGRRFTDAHSASAVCSPSRYALVTGQYPSRKTRGGRSSSETRSWSILLGRPSPT